MESTIKINSRINDGVADAIVVQRNNSREVENRGVDVMMMKMNTNICYKEDSPANCSFNRTVRRGAARQHLNLDVLLTTDSQPLLNSRI